MKGEKKLLRCTQVNSLTPPPDLKSLAVEQLWQEVKTNERLLQYLPDLRPHEKPPRTYFFAVLSTLFPQEYTTMLDRAYQEKEAQRKESHKYTISSEMHDTLTSTKDYFTYVKSAKSQHYLQDNRRFRGWD